MRFFLFTGIEAHQRFLLWTPFLLLQQGDESLGERAAGLRVLPGYEIAVNNDMDRPRLVGNVFCAERFQFVLEQEGNQLIQLNDFFFHVAECGKLFSSDEWRSVWQSGRY